MTENVVLDTTIHEPPLMGSTEIEILLFAIERGRAQFAWKVGGLDAAALTRPHPPTTMTLGGLIKHVAGCEERTTALHLTGGPLPAPWDVVDHEADRDWEWRTAADDSPEELYTLWHDAVERSRAAVAELLVDGRGADQPSKYVTKSGESPNLRRVLIDIAEHYIRHTGHADLLREPVDGLVGEDPPQP